VVPLDGTANGRNFRGYAAWKEKHFPGSPIMMLHGDLFLSLMGRHEGTIASVTMNPGGGRLSRWELTSIQGGFDYPPPIKPATCRREEKKNHRSDR